MLLIERAASVALFVCKDIKSNAQTGNVVLAKREGDG